MDMESPSVVLTILERCWVFPSTSNSSAYIQLSFPLYLIPHSSFICAYGILPPPPPSSTSPWSAGTVNWQTSPSIATQTNTDSVPFGTIRVETIDKPNTTFRSRTGILHLHSQSEDYPSRNARTSSILSAQSCAYRRPQVQGCGPASARGPRKR